MKVKTRFCPFTLERVVTLLIDLSDATLAQGDTTFALCGKQISRENELSLKLVQHALGHLVAIGVLRCTTPHIVTGAYYRLCYAQLACLSERIWVSEFMITTLGKQHIEHLNDMCRLAHNLETFQAGW